MSISSVSGSSSPPQPPAQDSAFRTAFQQLTTAISSGDTQGAQSAYATLSQLQQSSGNANSNNPVSQFLSTIGNDLQNGDISTAQSDLTAFQQQRASHHHKGPPPADGSGDASAAGAAASTTSSSSSSTNLVDISA
jgi:hypothetical protein